MKQLPELLLALGFVLVVTSLVVGWILIPAVIDEEITQKLRLEEGTEVWDVWSDTPIPIYLKIHIFNVTNPDEVKTGGKPKLEEIGPYVYQEKRKKIDVTPNRKNNTLFYRQIISYYFRRELSVGSEDDVITILNVPFLAIAQKTRELPSLLAGLAASYFSDFNETLFVQRKVEQILFKGRFEPMINEIQSLTGMETLPNSTFGFLVGKNGSDDGVLEIHSGVNNVNRFGEIVSWEGKSTLDWWRGESCNKINGSDGSLFPPFRTKNDVLYIFNSDICRSISLNFNEDTEFRGIPGYRYTPPKAMLEDSRVNGDNACFCTQILPEDKPDCLLAGAMSLKSCRDGAPVVMSTPHFLDGDEIYIQAAGLSPDRSKHQTLLDIEPLTGVVINAFKRIQFNVELKKLKAFSEFRKVTPILFPLFWIEEGASIDAESAQRLKDELLTPLSIFAVLKWGVIVLGWILNLAAVFIILIRYRKSKPYV